MELKDIPVGLTGQALMDAIKNTKEKRQPLAEGFLYEQTITMMAADPGTGKSTISIQMAVELASGLPVFGVFKVKRPLKILYIQTERSIIELLERLELLTENMLLNPDNLTITAEYQKFNLLREEDVPLFIDCIKRDRPGVEVIIIDPIYSIVRGGLKEDLQASIFTKVMTNVQQATGAALWYNHHTTKSQYNTNGEKIEKDDPFYGSQWLKAHVTGSYYLKEVSGGVKMELKKDNYGLLPKSIILDYNAETGMCSIPLEDLPAEQRLNTFLDSKDQDQKTFTFNDIITSTKLCKRTVRHLLLHSSANNRVIVVSRSKNKNLYKTDPYALAHP